MKIFLDAKLDLLLNVFEAVLATLDTSPIGRVVFSLPVVATAAEDGGIADVVALFVMVSDDVLVDSCTGTLEAKLARTVLTGLDFDGGEDDLGSRVVVVFRAVVTSRVRGVAGLLDGSVSACVSLVGTMDIVSSTVSTEVALTGPATAWLVVVDLNVVVIGFSSVGESVTEAKGLRAVALGTGLWSSVVAAIGVP